MCFSYAIFWHKRNISEFLRPLLSSYSNPIYIFKHLLLKPWTKITKSLMKKITKTSKKYNNQISLYICSHSGRIQTLSKLYLRCSNIGMAIFAISWSIFKLSDKLSTKIGNRKSASLTYASSMILKIIFHRMYSQVSFMTIMYSKRRWRIMVRLPISLGMIYIIINQNICTKKAVGMILILKKSKKRNKQRKM